MQIQFFSIVVNNPQETVEELNSFLRSHKVISVQRELVHDAQDRSGQSPLSIYHRHNQKQKDHVQRNSRKDYKKSFLLKYCHLFTSEGMAQRYSGQQVYQCIWYLPMSSLPPLPQAP